MRNTRTANCILASAGAFIVLMGISMAAYPGGTWIEKQTHGHDFLRNFLCDLLGPTAINGEANPVGTIVTPIAMMILFLGLLAAWWTIPTIFPTRSSLAIAIRILGSASVAGLAALPFTPPSDAYETHSVFALISGVTGLAAGVLSTVLFHSVRRTRRLAVLSALTVAFVLIGVTLYAHQVAAGGSPTILLPISHRIATAFLLCWMVAVALYVRTERAVPA